MALGILCVAVSFFQLFFAQDYDFSSPQNRLKGPKAVRLKQSRNSHSVGGTDGNFASRIFAALSLTSKLDAPCATNANPAPCKARHWGSRAYYDAKRKKKDHQMMVSGIGVLTKVKVRILSLIAY